MSMFTFFESRYKFYLNLLQKTCGAKSCNVAISRKFAYFDVFFSDMRALFTEYLRYVQED